MIKQNDYTEDSAMGVTLGFYTKDEGSDEDK